MAPEETVLENEIARLRGLDVVALQARWRDVWTARTSAPAEAHAVADYRSPTAGRCAWRLGPRNRPLSRPAGQGWLRQVGALTRRMLHQTRHSAGARVGRRAPSRDGAR